MGGRHARDDPEGDEQAVLGAEHELADAREPPDPRGLTEGMLLNVPRRLGPRRLGAGGRGVDNIAVAPWRRGASAGVRRVAGSRPRLMLSVPGQRLRYRSENANVVDFGLS
jgi:hypothetical protein